MIMLIGSRFLRQQVSTAYSITLRRSILDEIVGSAIEFHSGSNRTEISVNLGIA